MTRTIQSAFLLVSLLFMPKAYALVASANGNYFTGFVDIKSTNERANFLQIKRIYNSQTEYNGMLGYGWGTEFESILLVSNKNTVSVIESGGGTRTKFEHNSSSSNRQLKAGMKLTSSNRGKKQHLEVLPGGKGFVRTLANGEKIYFTHRVILPTKQRFVGQKTGYRVTKIVKVRPTKDTITIKYSNNNLKKISNRSGYLSFTIGPNGKVKAIRNSDKKEVRYTYCPSKKYSIKHKCGKGDLITSKDAIGNTFKYEYDAAHNLTKITYPSSRQETITYWSPSSQKGKGGMVKELKVGNLAQRYTYWSNPKNTHFKTSITTTSGKKVTKREYEYWYGKREDGSLYKKKFSSTVNGKKTTTTYNGCCSQPLKILSGKDVTTYEYYPSGSLKMKDSPKKKTIWQYSRKFPGKPTKVTTFYKKEKRTTTYTYGYALNGLLKKAAGPGGKEIKIVYDRQGRLATFVNGKGQKVKFNYFRKSSRLTRIEQENVGAIDIGYDKAGKMNSAKAVARGGSKRSLANSTQGKRAIVSTITRTFQGLLEIIRPAGVQPI